MTEHTQPQPTADLYDERGDALDSVSLQFQDLGGATRFAGPIRTIRCHRDNALVKQLLNTPGEGAVLVVDGARSLESALMGDMIAESAVANGWAGVIINGAIRDRAAIAELRLGVKALGSNPRKSAKDGAGEIDVPVSFGGVTFEPGGRLWADEDGILVEPASTASAHSSTARADGVTAPGAPTRG
ncbi:ribonuclease E activity regulator RraA [Brevibacterium sp. 5221]|uniref:4-hydroxy-4-methyl-2-oxoglutarate aldolase n=1 Tax=Brevibacterium rongguiense TaxID=2695267 RepID=A0A6N9H4N8_9MICO|nr:MULTISPECIES: ribonuclease E activity regulator RraA [Brevibacterium]MYM18574.1 ribonuclease E activity regulator RraA [Brevibacterium rongguiense]WAL39648.1 ribonuclease E activity regulator RraA [Brevibacterium sp. BRM-1]